MSSSSSSTVSFRFPRYQLILPYPDTVVDIPGPRCGHTFTVAGIHMILFGGSSTVVSCGGSVPDISLEGVTNSVYCFNTFNREWTRVYPSGEAPSPRADHAAASFNRSGVYIQGGIGPSGPCTGDLYFLKMSYDRFKWKRVEVQGLGPGPRYGHVMGFANNRLVIFGGKIGNEVLDDTWALDLTRPYVWERLNPIGNLPSGRMYASASTGTDESFVLCGGRDDSGVPLGDVYRMQMLSDGRWEWTSLPSVANLQRYHHTAVFVKSRLHVVGGVLSEARPIEAVSSVAVLDATNGVWFERNGPGTYNPSNNEQYSTQLLRRRRHAAASLDCQLFVYGGIGGLTEGVLLQDLLVSEPPAKIPTVDPGFYASTDEGYFRIQSNDLTWDQTETKLCPMITIETVENEARVARQLTLDQFETERRMSDMPQFTRQKSTRDLVEKVISTLLKPDSWEPPANGGFFLSYSEVEELCHAAVQIFIEEPTVLQLKVPIKVFGDLHGQFGDLMNLFRVYGEPSVKGDITSTDYLFLGDYVDRGDHSLETIILLIALKIKYPKNIHLIRGNHESDKTNCEYGFWLECVGRMGAEYGFQAWQRINLLFNYLPLAALLEKKIFCVHGGIGKVESLEQVENIQRPLLADSGNESSVIKDLLWSDPTRDDKTLGIIINYRGTGVAAFGPDIVEKFCQRNNLDMIIRAHECVMDGFKRSAQGRLMTVFSAPNYCGREKNTGAILVIGKDLKIYPKLIRPESEMASDDIASMQVQDSEELAFPVGGGPNLGLE